MRRRGWARGSRIAVLLGSLTLVLAGCSAKDWERDLRFGWPTGVTKQAERMRVLWTWSGVLALFLGVIVWGLIFWCCIRYRKRADDQLPRQTKYNLLVEVVCFTFPFLVIAGLFWRTVVVENYVNHLTKNPDVRVQVDAFKWQWQFEYHSYTDAGGTVHKTTYPGQKDLSDAAGNAGLESQKERTATPPRTCDEAASNDSYVCGASGDDNAAGGPLYLSTVGTQQDHPGAGPAGEPQDPDRRALRGRRALLLGAAVPLQARRHPVRHDVHGPGQPVRDRGHEDGQLTSAGAPSCAARTTRR